MDSNRINDDQARVLLSRYWACETSVDEEKALRLYFSQPNLPLDLLEYRSLFVFVTAAQKQQSDRPLQAPQTLQISHRRENFGRRNIWLSVAASVALLIGTFFWLRPTPPRSTDETKPTTIANLSEEQQQVINQTKAALMLISNKMQKGKTKLKK